MAKRGIPPDYGKRITELREQAGLTQTHLAERMGVTPAAVSQWESGASRPSARRWQQIVRAETLGVHALSDDYASDPLSGQPVAEERVAYEVGSGASAGLTFSTDPEIVRLVMGCQRLAYGHLVNPTFATETSQIQPLPHQRTAVYERMLGYEGELQHRLRFLLADDAGAARRSWPAFTSARCWPAA